jgi:glycosyltransferase involved in cell wall biosynthesis
MAEKIKILFVIQELGSGGAERSLISLLQALNDDRLKIFLQVFKPTGLFYSLVPPYVTLLPVPESILTLTTPVRKSISFALRHPIAYYHRLQAAFHIRTNNLPARREIQSIWKWWRRAIPRDPAYYDVAVGYSQTTPLYYVVDKTYAKRKIGWFHTDYIAANYDPEIDRPYFHKLDVLATITEASRNSLLKAFPELDNIIRVIPNLISVKTIHMLAESAHGFTDNFKGFRILTIARLSKEKGIDMAVETCAILVNRGFNTRWYVIGQGSNSDALCKQILSLGLREHFILLGEQSNPYPYLKESDIYVQPSRYEGKCIALEEAKLLCKPLVATAYNSVADQVIDGITGLVADMSAIGLANEISRLLNEAPLRLHLVKNLSAHSDSDDDMGSPRAFLNMIGLTMQDST